MERDNGGCVHLCGLVVTAACVILICIPFIAEAIESDLEKEIQQSLIRSRALVLQAHQKINSGVSIDEEVAKIKDLSESIRVAHAHAYMIAILNKVSSGNEESRKRGILREGSVLEHKIFEDDLEVESISTAKLMQLANSRQIPILTLDKANIGSTTLPFDAGIVDDLKNAANQNLLVKIPNQEMTYQDWTGTGYTKEDLQTKEAGYMLSGMIAGGMTAVSPDKWPYQYLVEVLDKPYAGQYTIVSITSPRNESILYASPITVSGIALDPSARVTVNGLEAYREGNAFIARGIQLTRGINRITATATTSEGISVSSSINVKYRILLRSFITFPYEGANLSVQSVDVEGVVSDPAAAIEVNGITAVVSADGRFIASNIALFEGANLITVRATNLEGDVDLQTISVIRQATQAEPIQLTIISPTGNEAISRQSVLVRGTVETVAEEVWVKVNGVLAEVHEGQFTANSVALNEGNNVIIVNATDSSGGVGRAEVMVQADITAPHVTLNANITSGIADLKTYFQVKTELPNSITTYQMDFEGDGIIDYTDTKFEDISHTYNTEGIYYPTVTVTDDQGNTYSDTMAITVLNRARIDSILKGIWEGMKAKLMAGDVEKGLSFFSRSVQSRYRDAFHAINDELPRIVSAMQPIELIYVAENAAKYRINRTQDIDGQSKIYTYYLYFIRDGNGNWKIDRF